MGPGPGGVYRDRQEASTQECQAGESRCARRTLTDQKEGRVERRTTGVDGEGVCGFKGRKVVKRQEVPRKVYSRREFPKGPVTWVVGGRILDFGDGIVSRNRPLDLGRGTRDTTPVEGSVPTDLQ